MSCEIGTGGRTDIIPKLIYFGGLFVLRTLQERDFSIMLECNTMTLCGEVKVELYVLISGLDGRECSALLSG
jgi:hypothetical protein